MVKRIQRIENEYMEEAEAKQKEKYEKKVEFLKEKRRKVMIERNSKRMPKSKWKEEFKNVKVFQDNPEPSEEELLENENDKREGVLVVGDIIQLDTGEKELLSNPPKWKLYMQLDPEEFELECEMTLAKTKWERRRWSSTKRWKWR